MKRKVTNPKALSNWLIMFPCYLVITFFASLCHSGVIHIVSDSIKDPQLREKVIKATTRLQISGGDLEALETIVRVVGEDAIKTINTGVNFGFSNPVKGDAFRTINDWFAMPFLIEVLENGSDLATLWSLNRLERQSSETKFEDSIDSNGQKFVDSLAQSKTKRQLRKLLKSIISKRIPELRAQALKVYTELEVDNGPKTTRFLIKNFDDDSELVIASTVENIDRVRSEDDELEEFEPVIREKVWFFLEHGKADELLIQCLSYLWLNDKESIDDKKLSILKKLAGHPTPRVRQSLTNALSQRATPKNQAAIDILLQLTKDKDYYTRTEAVRDLMYANTPDVNDFLKDIFLNRKSERNMRAHAFEVMGKFGIQNFDFIVQVSKDPYEYEDIRCKAFYYLRRIGTQEAREAIEAALTDPLDEIRSCAKKQLHWLNLRRGN